MNKVYWCVGDGIPMRVLPAFGDVVTLLPKYAKVNVIAESVIDIKGVPTKFFDVDYIETPKSLSHGWVYAGYLEPYFEEFASGIVGSKSPTPAVSDAQQYVIWHGKTQYNLCGYFSVCYCAGWSAEIEDFLVLLEEKKLSFITRRFPAWQSRGTSISDLDVMLSLFDYNLPSKTIGEALYDKVSGRMMTTAGRVYDLLKDNRLIYSVRIETRTGKLMRSGVLHWVVLDEIIPDEFRGAVKLYNPFNDKHERYDWTQVLESGGIPHGIVVPR